MPRCSACNAPLDPAARVCPACGRPNVQLVRAAPQATRLAALADYLHGPIGWRRAFEMLAEVCAWLAEEHTSAVILRTVKPTHIHVVDKDGAAVLRFATGGDPELDERTRRARELRGIVLDVDYMSPEELMGKWLDPRSTIYVLGVVAYELVTGARPFADARSLASLITAQLKRSPVPPSHARPAQRIPRRVDEILLRCLAKHRDARYADVVELARALTDVLASEPAETAPDPASVAAPPPPPPPAPDAIAQTIAARPCGSATCHALHRVLPARGTTSHLGHWMSLEHLDASVANRGDSPPHPHVAVATLSYLFEGRLTHRDSLGNVATLAPGELNLLRAGRGAVHSERRDRIDLLRGAPFHGVELRVALPETEDDDPSFEHFDADALPVLVIAGARVRIVLGTGFGARSPVADTLPVSLLDARLASGAAFPIPAARGQIDQRAVYVVSGAVELGGTVVEARNLAVLQPAAAVGARAIRNAPAHLLVLASAPIRTQCYFWWGFVARSMGRIEEAKRRWVRNEFAAVPGESDPVPLPE